MYAVGDMPFRLPADDVPVGGCGNNGVCGSAVLPYRAPRAGSGEDEMDMRLARANLSKQLDIFYWVVCELG
jgi:hypothetical protein